MLDFLNDIIFQNKDTVVDATIKSKESSEYGEKFRLKLSNAYTSSSSGRSLSHILQTSRIQLNSNPNIAIFKNFEGQRLANYEKNSSDDFKDEEKMCNNKVSAYLNLKHFKKDKLTSLQGKVEKLSSHIEKSQNFNNGNLDTIYENIKK